MRLRILALLVLCAGCARETAPPAQPPSAPSVLIVTIDTLRADRVGAYGYRAARTPALDALAGDGRRFDRAYAAAPITLTSHATIMTGRYPPGHGARHNGMRLDPNVPTLAEAFTLAGAATAAFVAAFPLDRRFGLIKGFQTYGDTMPRDAGGHVGNERPGREVVDAALAWLRGHRDARFFLWVHLFEPHAPYGNPADPAQARRSAAERYDEEVAEADRQAGRLIAAIDRSRTLVVAAADHGEAFGEHGEISHSLFIYDTTLRVPLILAGPGVQPGVVSEPVSLVDVAPTIASLAALGTFDSDGGILPGVRGPASGVRSLYAESFAPLLDFGWAPLRAIRRGGWKYIAAPTAELYDLEHDPGETRNLAATDPARAAELARLVDAMSPATRQAGGGDADVSAVASAKADLSAVASAKADPETRARLQALGYAAGRPSQGGARPDPKDRRELAARIAEVTSGELQGAALERALRDIIRRDPGNPQANVRLGYVLMNSGRCGEAIGRFTAAIEGHLPGTDAHLGRAGCEIAAKDPAAARRTLTTALALEPDNAVILANLGLLVSDTGHPVEAIPQLQRALTIDPDLHQARFGLAIAYARTGRRGAAAQEAEELLRRLPPNAPQRAEVQRLLASVR